MANMSYCRFVNTFHDLEDCDSTLYNFINEDDNCITSDSERMYAKKIIKLCKYIADNYDEDDIDRMSEHYGSEEYVF